VRDGFRTNTSDTPSSSAAGSLSGRVGSACDLAEDSAGDGSGEEDKSRLLAARSTITTALHKHKIQGPEVDRLLTYMSDYMIKHAQGQARDTLPENLVPTAASITWLRDRFDAKLYTDWRTAPQPSWGPLDKALTDVWSHISDDELPRTKRQRDNDEYRKTLVEDPGASISLSLYKPYGSPG
jgi:hypothetical protein